MRRDEARAGRRPPRQGHARALMVTMVVLLVVYTAGLLLGDPATFDPLLDGWLCIFTEFAAVGVCISAMVRTRCPTHRSLTSRTSPSTRSCSAPWAWSCCGG